LRRIRNGYESLVITFACIILFIALSNGLGGFYYTLISLGVIEDSPTVLALINFGLLIFVFALRYYLIYIYKGRRNRNTMYDDYGRSEDEEHHKELLINRYRRRNREEAEDGQKAYLNYCPFCNSEIEYSFTYCPKCGRLIR
jgi:hypothetical protein